MVRCVSPATTSTSIGGSSVRVAAMTVRATAVGAELLAATSFFVLAVGAILAVGAGFPMDGACATLVGAGEVWSTSVVWSEPNQVVQSFTTTTARVTSKMTSVMSILRRLLFSASGLCISSAMSCLFLSAAQISKRPRLGLPSHVRCHALGRGRMAPGGDSHSTKGEYDSKGLSKPRLACYRGRRTQDVCS